MPKRRRLTPVKNKAKSNNNKQLQPVQEDVSKVLPEKEVSTPRGRLKGALLDVLEPALEESDNSLDQSPVKKLRKDKRKEGRSESSDEDDQSSSAVSPPRQSYVLKLFDRSVDLSQFNEESPLYPICRAWIINQPKANYKDLGKRHEVAEQSEDNVELPGPEGPPISRIPNLIPDQQNRSKDNINLNYREAPPPSRDQLLEWHATRWSAVRGAWLQRAAQVEARYAATQLLLNKINVNAM